MFPDLFLFESLLTMNSLILIPFDPVLEFFRVT